MGQEFSEPIDDSIDPLHLARRDLKSVAEYINSGRCENIAMMVGAGISTSAGIPDFRSPDTGLYANLQKLDLPSPESVFDISYFRTNPVPFYTLAHDMWPGKYRPTITHSFIRLLELKGLLKLCWTQNIDTLERAAGVSGDKLIEAHGSFAGQHCIECRAPYPDDMMLKHVQADPVEVPTCFEGNCNGLVKPDITFFGEALPAKFIDSMPHLEDIDLAIVMGTSLSVYPFASLPMRVQQGVPRLLINREKVGEIGSRRDDVVFLKQCDEGVRKLAEELGWLQELEDLWAETAPKRTKEEIEEEERKKNIPLEERLDEEVEKLTRDVEASLKLSMEHKAWVESQLEKDKKTRDEKAKGSEDKDQAAPSSPVLSYKPEEALVGLDVPKQEVEKEEDKTKD